MIQGLNLFVSHMVYVIVHFLQNLEGSRSFVEDRLIPTILEQHHISPDTFHGAYILDTVLNYDNTPHSQTLPEGLDTVSITHYSVQLF